MAGGAKEQEGLKVVLDASSLVSAMLKVDSIPRQAVDHIAGHPGRLVISQAVEEEYYEVLLRPKFDRASWPFTDDTEMSLPVVATPGLRRRINDASSTGALPPR